MPRITKRSSCQALDPRTLGRPVHLLPRFTEQLQKDLTELLRNALNRRYQSDFRVSEITMSPAGGQAVSGRLQVFVSAHGNLGVAIERTLVLAILGYRYGAVEGTSTPADQALPPETATEERLCGKLGLQFAELAAGCVESMKAGEDGRAPLPLQPSPGTGVSRRGAWTVAARIEDARNGASGSLQILLDEVWIARLLQYLAPPRDRQTGRAAHAAGAALAGRLQLTLVGRLLEKDVLLEELFELKVGSVIPVSLGATDVLVDKSRLFTAAVAEHNGKLCLTSFQDSD